ncbi:hypothetical protein FSP39_017387 [Pinctada imbricata]|uniref:Mutator-like transposase domain-containing protein n=1 Tax=Pinctada imbricata TaxID=66713 RepID=A0AA88YSR7_PINIB|nr:hypothetical protein FSP39_017387 [Pinctada imbricata]
MERAKEANRNEFGRKKRKSDNGEAMKMRNEKRKEKEDKNISGNLRFYVSSENDKVEIFDMIDRAKLLLSERVSLVSNAMILREVFQFYLSNNGGAPDQQNEGETESFKPYLRSPRDNCMEDICLISESSLKNLVAGISDHGLHCKERVEIDSFDTFGHVQKLTLKCKDMHTIKIDTSSRLPGGKFLVNLRVLHGIYSSGLRYAQYERFAKYAGIGVIPESAFHEVQDMFCDVTDDAVKESVSDALDDEVGTTVLECDNVDDYKGITIVSDARHGWRKNSRFSDIISLGYRTNKVVGYAVVSHGDDPCSQRHELHGVKKLYEGLSEKGANVHIHGHDRNVSINNYLKTQYPEVTNANDTWHATKNVAKELKKVCSGPQYQHGKTWHGELSDKSASIKTHTYYAIKNCDGSPDKLRANLDNIIPHYQNIHSNCAAESRCRTDPNYIPSKVILTDKVAIKLLDGAVKNLQIYKTPADYCSCIDTHYVECFNNACLIYHDKRIVYSDKEYKRRTAMAILDWNENIDRDYTSITYTEDARNPRRKTGKKHLKPKTGHYCANLLSRILDILYANQ